MIQSQENDIVSFEVERGLIRKQKLYRCTDCSGIYRNEIPIYNCTEIPNGVTCHVCGEEI